MALNIGRYVSNAFGRVADQATKAALQDQSQKVTELARDTNAELVPAGAIVMFDDRDTCPPGWTLVTAFVGRFPRGVSSGAGTDGGSDSHSHPAGTLATSASGTTTTVFEGDGSGGTEAVSHPSHAHAVTGSTGSADNIPAFRQVIFCKKD